MAQDPAPPATYSFEKDAVYLEKKKLLITQINQSPSVQGLDSLTQWAALHKDWETVLDLTLKIRFHHLSTYSGSA